jgi:acetyl esterase
MPVDPQVQVLLDQMAAAGAPPITSLMPEQARLMMAAMTAMGGPPEPVAIVEDLKAPGPAGDIPVRKYATSAEGNRPALVFYHGGGFVIGNIESHDPLCRSLANQSGCTVLSVDYRLAPEAKFPAAPEDCFAALRWAHQNAAALGIDSNRIAVGGDSAGGNLSAVVSQMARDAGGPPVAFQLLIYPATDMAAETESYERNGKGYFLEKDDSLWFLGHYLRDEADKANVLASPMRAKDLSGLPPALIITAEYDPLLDDGVAYADRLREAGVPVTYSCYDGMVHGFLSMAGVLDGGKRAIAESAAALRAALAAAQPAAAR